MRLRSSALCWLGSLLSGVALLCAAPSALAGNAEASTTKASDKGESGAEAETEEGNGDPSQTGVPIEVASKAQKEVARKQLQLGIDLLDAAKPTQALEVLRMSFQRVASPNTRLMIARALQRLDRYPEAYTELQIALAESRALARGASKYEETVEALEAELSVVRPKVALVRLDLGMSVTSGGQVVQPTQWGQPLVLPAGPAAFELKLTNGQSTQQRLELQGGQEVTVPLRVDQPATQQVNEATPATPNVVEQAPPSNDVSRRSLAWVGVGVAGVGAASFVAFGLLDRASYARLEDECTDTSCPSSLRDEAESGRTYQALANVGLGVGVVGLLTATYFFLTAEDSAPELGVKQRSACKRPQRALARAHSGFEPSAPKLFVGTSSVTLTGSF